MNFIRKLDFQRMESMNFHTNSFRTYRKIWEMNESLTENSNNVLLLTERNKNPFGLLLDI